MVEDIGLKLCNDNFIVRGFDLYLELADVISKIKRLLVTWNQ